MRATVWAVVAIAWLASASGASAKPRRPLFSIAIGYNGLPPASDPQLASLRYADDDAAAFHQFARMLTRHAFLLATLDPETQARFPELAKEARAPSLADLRQVIAEIQARIDVASAAGEEPVVLIFYSGHGAQAAGGQAALTFIDGLLTRDMLYDEILAGLHPRFLHLFVDACNAEAVVRPRNAQAQVVQPSAQDLRAAFQKDTLSRFPYVGAVVASTVGAPAHEWDVYQSGIFTHELLSALRGAADIDSNGRIEYSELGAFLSAANRDVGDPRAKPHTIVHPPPLDSRIEIVDLADAQGAAFLEGRSDQLGGFFIEDAHGVRLVDLRAEPFFRVSLALPAGETLYLRNHDSGATMRLEAGQRLPFERVQLGASDVRVRGALETALRRGLFATRFGPGYYRGFVDQQEELLTVALRDPDVTDQAAAGQRITGPNPHGGAARISFGVAAALAAGAGIFGGLSFGAHQDFENTYLERAAQDANNRYQRDLTVSLISLGAAVIAGGVGAYFLYKGR